MKDKKNILIGALLVAVMVMAVGYATFTSTLNINGTATIVGDWQVEITGITPVVTGAAVNGTDTNFTAATATFDAELKQPGDSITYTVTVENKGSIDAKLNSITLTPQTTVANSGEGSDAILYEIVSAPAQDSVLKAGDEATVVIKVTYDENVTTVPDVTTRTFTGVIEYVQNS